MLILFAYGDETRKMTVYRHNIPGGGGVGGPVLCVVSLQTVARRLLALTRRLLRSDRTTRAARYLKSLRKIILSNFKKIFSIY